MDLHLGRCDGGSLARSHPWHLRLGFFNRLIAIEVVSRRISSLYPAIYSRDECCTGADDGQLKGLRFCDVKQGRDFMTSTEQASVPAMSAFVIGGTGMLLCLLPYESVSSFQQSAVWSSLRIAGAHFLIRRSPCFSEIFHWWAAYRSYSVIPEISMLPFSRFTWPFLRPIPSIKVHFLLMI